MEYFICQNLWICLKNTFVQQFSMALREILHVPFEEEQISHTSFHGSTNVMQ